MVKTCAPNGKTEVCPTRVSEVRGSLSDYPHFTAKGKHSFMSESNEVARPLITSNEDTLRDIHSFSDAMQVLSDAGIDIRSTEEFGDGFRVLEDKSRLVKTPFIVLGYKFAQGDNGEFVIIHAVTDRDEKLIITDGSTGIKEQMKKYQSHGIHAGLLVRDGLVKSDYTFKDENGNDRPATTYYLSA